MTTTTTTTTTTTRVAICYDDTGMVVGDGATEGEAWDDAIHEARSGAGDTRDQDTLGAHLRSSCSAVTYDPAESEIALRDGIVQIVRR